VIAKEDPEVKNLKKAAAVMMVAGGLVAAGAGMASAAEGGAYAGGQTAGMEGVASGNLVQAPVDAPVNVSGNSVNVAGVFNPAVGN
jgi:hypothetical protein